MKRSLALVLGLALLAPIGLIGCGEESKPAAAPAAGAGGAPPAGGDTAPKTDAAK